MMKIFPRMKMSSKNDSLVRIVILEELICIRGSESAGYVPSGPALRDRGIRRIIERSVT